MASKVRFERMLDDRSVYLESLIQERKQIFDKKLAEFQVIFFFSLAVLVLWGFFTRFRPYLTLNQI